MTKCYHGKECYVRHRQKHECVFNNVPEIVELPRQPRDYFSQAAWFGEIVGVSKKADRLLLMQDMGSSFLFLKNELA